MANTLVSVPFRGYVVVITIADLYNVPDWVSVPFRGYVVVIQMAGTCDRIGVIVSVPFRGYVVVIPINRPLQERWFVWFPSPFGVM